MIKPDYKNSIVNLMASIHNALGTATASNLPLPSLEKYDIDKYDNIVLMLIDGLGYDYLRRRGESSFLAQHTKEKLSSVFPTTTASAISTFATAQTTSEHAVTGWFMYLQELNAVAAILPYIERGTGERLEQRMALDKNVSLDAIYKKIDRQSYVINHERIIESSFSKISSAGAERVPYGNLTQYFSAIEHTVKQSSDQKYLFAYWPEFDTLNHSYGTESEHVYKHFNDIDLGVRNLVESLRNTNTLLLLTADHGMLNSDVNKTVSVNNHPELLACLAQPLCGEPRIAYCYVKPEKRRTFEAYIAQHLADACDLYLSETLIEQNLFGQNNSHPLLRSRVGDYILIMKDNYVIKDYVANEKPFSQIGVHGGLTEYERFVPLVVVEI